jgi:hypothetical protein
MAENESFFRKVVRFVANPATDWTDLQSRQEDTRELELEKSELKAMIERKRRNDFVRKREFDMLRRVRREGLSPEQLAALGGSSRLDDSEALAPPSASQRPAGVKAKIDEIEQQMVGDAGFGSGRSSSALGGNSLSGRGAAAAPLKPAMAPLTPIKQPTTPSNTSSESLDPVADAAAGLGAGGIRPMPPTLSDALKAAGSATPSAKAGGTLGAAAAASLAGLAGAGSGNTPEPRALPDLNLPLDFPDLPVLNSSAGAASGQAPAPASGRTKPMAPAAAGEYSDFGSPFAVEVSEVVHDPELDEAVIAFANADFSQCEEALQRITQYGGTRWQHADTWLVLFDLYRATGQQQRFESLAVEYAQQFGWSAPQWYSLPKLVADAQAEESANSRVGSSTGGGGGAGGQRDHGDVGWLCPEHLDTEAVGRLRSQSLQMPMPWVFDWQNLRRIDAEAATQLSTLFRLWAGQAIEMRWLSGERLFSVLQDSAPNGVRDADPAFWLTRLDALRMANRVDQFDEAAIEYCMTYEVSPPSWEPTRCKVRVSHAGLSTRSPSLSMVSEVSTSFVESRMHDELATGTVEVAHVELSGQLVGDISQTLSKLKSEMNTAPIVSVSCARLIRVDFIAAGDLLNWVLSKRSENRAVHFVDSHRLVALFFGAMGINEHAKVQVRKV